MRHIVLVHFSHGTDKILDTHNIRQKLFISLLDSEHSVLMAFMAEMALEKSHAGGKLLNT